jgi:(2Fe-2S) ferredoxin
LENERGFTVRTEEDGIFYIEGDTFPVQVLESKILPPGENLFLRNLRSNLSIEDVKETAEAYKELKPYEKKNVYLDRLMQANRKMFKEAISVSDVVKEIFFEVAERDGWFTDREFEKAKMIAKKLLLLGRPIEEVVEATELPYETVSSLV